MQVAANTVGLDLVPVIPMPGPMGVLTYLDFVYGGGKLAGAGSQDNPITIKVDTTTATLVADTQYVIANGGNTAAIKVKFIGTSRIDGFSIFEVKGAAATGSGAAAGAGAGTFVTTGGATINAVIDGSDWDIFPAAGSGTKLLDAASTSASLVKALEDHITGFSGNEYGTNDPYSREVGETTQDNVMNLTLFNQSVEAKTFQVAAAVTREQVQDLKQFGVDAVAQVEAVLANELTQSINKNILERLFKLGVKNHANISATQSVHFHLNLADTATAIANFGDLTDSEGQPRTSDFDSTIAPTEGATVSNSENIHTRQRKIFSKVLACANMIAIRGRRGNANFMVTNGQIATALQDSAGFIAAPMANTLNQVGGSLYPVGTIGGVAVYVDPNMAWSDNRVLVGRKGDGNSPGLVFMPYLMAESVETIAEGTMAPKIAVKSRFALVEAGHHPETNYITFGIFSQYGIY
jgi:hypothetical protein